jgi:hypothetical protein
MDYTSEQRQQKFREKMKADGKKQRVFFLSDTAMDLVKKLKDETKSPSLNHALESLLTNLIISSESQNIFEPTQSTVIEKIITQPSDHQQKILDTAQKIGDVKRKLKKTPSDTPERELLVKEFTRLNDEIMNLTS